MKALPTITVLIFFLVSFLQVCQTEGQSCPAGWFGPQDCKYQCHCIENCFNNGTCQGTLGCEEGWFGPACQYADLVQDATVQPQEDTITDNNDNTCIRNRHIQSVSVSWREARPFTWLRIHVQNSGSLHNFNLEFTDNNDETRLCFDPKNATVTDKTLDIHCSLNFTVKKVTLNGEGVRDLCSLHISGGRNVALKQSTNQTGTYTDSTFDKSFSESDNAVDGNTSGDFYHKSCTHTMTDVSPYWVVNLASQKLVNRYKLYNRDSNGRRLKGFSLRSYNESGILGFNHTDTSNNVQPVYEVIDSYVPRPVKMVKISLTSGILTLCEVEMYGDSSCHPGSYGRECEHRCNCATSESCFFSTGGCPSGCAAGYHGESCTAECDSGHYGSDCTETCSIRCFNGECNPVNGTCDRGCAEGFKPPTCIEECDSGRYGKNCNESCSPHCINHTCNNVNGTCDSGCDPGYKLPLCVEECGNGTYGQDCKQYCSFHCFSGACDPVNGTCDNGCAQGYKPPMCFEQCDSGFHGYNCSEPCSINCRNQTCNATTGDCDECIPGYQGLQCDKECDPTYYGVDCQEQCSSQCLNSICHNVDGKCTDCPMGRTGDMCDQDCERGTFGHNCNETCGNCLEDDKCNNINGSCMGGCKDGYTDSYCTKECNAMTYGAGCSFNCSQFCNVNTTKAPEVCHHVNGACTLGCQSGYEEPTCLKLSPDDSKNIGVVAGPIIVIIILILAVALGIFVWRKRKSAKQNNLLDHGSQADITESGISRPEQTKTRRSSSIPKDRKASKDPNGFDPTPAGDSADNDYYNTAPGPYKTSIAVDDLTNFMLSHTKEYFEQQFAKIPVTCQAPQAIGLSPENKHKNRYKNIVAYDHSRVQLQSNSDKKQGDYINASYVHGYKDEEKYIASQGPNKVILDDFVRMLWEHKVDKVVMLTNLVEEGKHKCECYWPEENEVEFDEIKVRLAATQVFADYTIRRLQLMKVGDAPHSLTQFHFTTWPDKGVPTTPWGLVDFEQRVASYPTDKPIVVHCSAGVGRTGTFIALRKVMREAEDTGYMDFYSILWKLRQDRVYMIQTAEQYIFLHEAARVAMACIGTTVTSDDIAERMKALETKSESGQSNMEKEFKAVCNVCADNEDGNDEEGSGGSASGVYINSRTVTNKSKNRFSNILPKEFYRPYLSCETKDMGDYINAVLLPSFTKQNHQILTQLPLSTTVIDFWRLVTQYKVSLVIAFEADSDDMTIGTYLPSSEQEPLHCGSFDIMTEPATSDSLWVEQNLTVTFHKKRKTRLSTSSTHTEEYHLTHLKCTKASLDPESLLAFVKKAKSCSGTEHGKTLYMCRNGADYSGLVCVLSLLLDRMNNDHCLTVPLVVGAIKAIRPQVIPTLDQYRCLYQVLMLYNEGNSVYCNFGGVETKNSTHLEMSNRAFDANDDADINVYANS